MNPALDVEGLVVDHGGLRAVDDVSLRVGVGEIVGLIGPNGAGKTSLIDAVCGYTAARSGRVALNGQSIGHLAAHERARQGLGRTFQSLELFDDLTVAQNLAVMVHRAGYRGLAADLAGPRHSNTSGSPEVRSTLEVVGLTAVAQRIPTELSNGQRHLVALGRAVAASPTVVCLDEPAAGLDPAETDQLAAVIRSVAAGGSAILLVDHDMDLMFGICDRLEVLDFGCTIASGSPEDVRRNPVVIEAYLGEVHPATRTQPDPQGPVSPAPDPREQAP